MEVVKVWWAVLCGGGEGGLGLVLSFTDHKESHSLRSWRKVTWNAGTTNDYKVGHEGKVDLMMIEGASGGYYYPDHLAPLGHYTSLPQDLLTGKHVQLISLMTKTVCIAVEDSGEI